MNNKQQFFLNLFTKTWCRDSHGLYDYESMQTKDLNVVLSDNGVITRKKHDIKISKPIKDKHKDKDSSKDTQDDELLLNLKHEGSKYSIDNPVEALMTPTEENITGISNKIWYILNYNDSPNTSANHIFNNTNDDYYLKKNDIIKLGRVKYALNEINLQEANCSLPMANAMALANPNSYNVNDINTNTSAVFDFIFKAKCAEDEANEENMCKICYSNTNDDENPLVHLCNCTGGIRFAHYQCIKTWMETKLSIKENEKKTVKSYSIRSFNCEICKTPYPYRFTIGNKKKLFDLINIEIPSKDKYILLESLNQMKDNCNIKSIHVIKLTDDKVIIGRGHESDVRINDISVSRTHGCLKYEKEAGRILLRDLKSKFGTLVLFKKPLELKERRIHLQIGRTYIEARLITAVEFEEMKKHKKNKQSKHVGNKDKDGNSNGNKDKDKDKDKDKGDGQNCVIKDISLTHEEIIAFLNDCRDEQ